jgi:hypothetical protein
LHISQKSHLSGSPVKEPSLRPPPRSLLRDDRTINLQFRQTRGLFWRKYSLNDYSLLYVSEIK